MSNQGRNDFGLYDRNTNTNVNKSVYASSSDRVSEGYTNDRQRVREERKSRRSAIRKRKIKKFIAIVLTLVSSFLLVSFGLIFTYIKLMVSPEEQENIYNLMTNSMNSAMEIELPSFAKTRITALLVGVDEEGSRTDTMMIATVNRKTNRVDLISIPRDTRITVPDDIITKYNKQTGYKYQKGWKIKLNEYNAYVSVLKDYSMDYLVELLEDMLNISIDYYAKIDTEAFREVIDELGGIEYNVPVNMYYNDPTQNLLINLKAGRQTLTGKQAEGLVRMRHCYINEDYGRMETQQNFLKEVFKQVMKKVSVTNLPALARTVFKYVETDFKIGDIPTAISIAINVDADLIKTHTIPSRPAEIGGISYVLHDQAETEKLIESIWYPEKYEAEKEVIKWGEY